MEEREDLAYLAYFRRNVPYELHHFTKEEQ